MSTTKKVNAPTKRECKLARLEMISKRALRCPDCGSKLYRDADPVLDLLCFDCDSFGPLALPNDPDDETIDIADLRAAANGDWLDDEKGES